MSFTLYSPVMDDNGYLPSNYTCDTTSIVDPCKDGVSPPLAWTSAPNGTMQFMITMTSLSVDNDDNDYFAADPSKETRYDWFLYNISSNTSFLTANTSDGVVGGTYPHDPYFCYLPPCSSGPGSRNYTFSIYAFNSYVDVDVLNSVDDDRPTGYSVIGKMYDNGLSDYFLGSANFTVHSTNEYASSSSFTWSPRDTLIAIIVVSVALLVGCCVGVYFYFFAGQINSYQSLPQTEEQEDDQ